ncbi:hypothetical protein [Streptomyces sp. LN245]|uniref:hypothetical protein n=1 Tax=Streptomyces sp. LN245 TaxID=3112975 RepID=UPI00371993E6
MTGQPARARMLAYLQQSGLSTARAEANIQAALDEHAHQLAERIRTTAADDDGPAAKWNWWDVAEIPGNCADLIDPEVKL